MLVLGIDPGTASTGYGFVRADGSRLDAVDGGMIETRAEVAPERRLAAIHSRICTLLDRHRPDAMAIEELYFGVNVQTAFAVGQGRGVVLLAAGQRAIPARGYTPQQVKSAVCGSGRASKDQVARMVARLLSLDAAPRPDHIADAFAVAICHLNAAPLQRTVEASGAPRAIRARGGTEDQMTGPGERGRPVEPSAALAALAKGGG